MIYLQHQVRQSVIQNTQISYLRKIIHSTIENKFCSCVHNVLKLSKHCNNKYFLWI